jgi:hypothetical protein
MFSDEAAKPKITKREAVQRALAEGIENHNLGEKMVSDQNGTGFFHNGLTSSRLRASRLLSFRNC